MNKVKDKDRNRLWLSLVVIAHLGVVLWHGNAHTMVPVPLTGAQTVFVVSVILLLPLIGIGLLWTRYKGLGAWIIALSMFGSLLFGVVNHYILESPDNVMALPERAGNAFIISAALLSTTEAIGTVLGLIAIRSWQRDALGGSTKAGRESDLDLGQSF